MLFAVLALDFAERLPRLTKVLCILEDLDIVLGLGSVMNTTPSRIARIPSSGSGPSSNLSLEI